MTFFQDYIAYVKDNPQKFWFKRKPYGYGWTPATKEGWIATLLFILFILAVIYRANFLQLSEEDALIQVIVPTIVATFVFLLVCYKKGESLKWQWKLPKSK